MEKEEKNINLATRIAWLHYIGGHTQADISVDLDLSTARINRLLAFAKKSNIVQFSINGDLSSCLDLEHALKERFGFKYCTVVPDLNEGNSIPLKALGIAGAEFINKQIDDGEHKLIGLGYGKTLSACVNHIQNREACDIELVSLSGGLTNKLSISPYDVIHRIAYRTNAPSYVIPSPMYLPSTQEKNNVLNRPDLQNVYHKILDSSLKIVGIGTTDENASILQTEIWDGSSLLQAKKQGATGEILGHFFNQDGEAMKLELSNKMINPTLDSLKETDIVAIAGGIEKAPAITALSKSGYVNGLIIDEKTAKKIIEL